MSIVTYLENGKRQEVVSIIEASEIYGCTRSRISAMIREGRLKTFQDKRGRKWVIKDHLESLKMLNASDFGTTKDN